MHPRNRHRDGYDFAALTKHLPELRAFVVPHPCGGDTIDFANAAAVTMLNRALLCHHYGINHWSVPQGYLCPAVPGRADYLHHVADLLAADHEGVIPTGADVTVLDVGVGANCIYPLIGVVEYGWRFVGTDIDREAIASAQTIVAANPQVADRIAVRHQNSPATIFGGAITMQETFVVSICNPPFHASEAQAAAGTLRKLRNLGAKKVNATVLNFGGQSHELWCEGGEPGFIQRMIQQSAANPHRCRWFTTLVSKSSSLPAIYRALDRARALDVRTIAMGQGQKQSRIVAWTFLPPEQRRFHASGAASASGS